ncbi:MAG: creatininase family protein [Candidatus Aphodomorpha sp.]
MEQDCLLQNLTAADLRARAAKAPAIILPLASIEILGAHGPVGLDVAVAEAVAPLIAQRTGCLVAPVIPYGDTAEFCAMDGTVHVPADVLEAYVYAVASSLLKTCGARAVLFLNVHSLNGFAASSVCRRLTAEGYAAATADWWAAVGVRGAELLADRRNGRGHGAEMITSVGMALCGDRMHMERATCEKPLPGLDAVNRWNGTPFRTFSNFHAYCIGGAWGDTTAASAEKGRALIDCGVEAIVAFLSEAFMQESAGQ